MKAEYYDHMGGDLNIVDAARVSFSKMSKLDVVDTDTFEVLEAALALEGFQKHDKGKAYILNNNDIKLIKFLSKEKHEIPFAHTAITLRCSAPVPIRTQCFKSKVGFVENEESRRYISSRPELYIPDSFRMKAEDKKQGSEGLHPLNKYWGDLYATSCSNAIDIYEDMVADGVCPEQARFILPQGVIVNWMWTGSLLAFARFYNLRSKKDAQKEVQVMAEEVSKIIQPLYPVAWKALTQ